MGMFDTVIVPCPRCTEPAEFQSKSGDCTLAVYPLSEAPTGVLADVNRHGPTTCRKCGCMFSIELTITARPVVWPG